MSYAVRPSVGLAAGTPIRAAWRDQLRAMRSNLERNHDLAEMLSGEEVAIGGDGVFELVGTVNDRAQACDGDGAVHRLEHRAAADIDAGDAQPFLEHETPIELAARS